MNQDRQEIRKLEEEHLKSCVSIIRSNIDRLSGEVERMRAETKEMYDNYRSGNFEMHNELVIGLALQDQTESTLYKNLRAEKKAYFGRIDYEEEAHGGFSREEGEENPKFSLYIGKNGIMQSSSEILIVDWRAPVASVYYDSDIGKSHYESPVGEEIRIDLQLKRTFELEEDRLADFYDTDVITNDEFLTKYLAKNKEVVLGEIIATIQKEQNTIIRDTPWHTVMVQGVAGSGKTTVAMHRISYILYNFKDKFQPSEFYVIGSNKMLLNYITGVLPSLDVKGINQMTLEEMVIRLLGRDFKPARAAAGGMGKKAAVEGGAAAKRSYQVVDSFSRLAGGRAEQEIRELLHLKGSLAFPLALEYFLAGREREELCQIPEEGLSYRGKMLYNREDLEGFLSTFSAFRPETGTVKPGGVPAEEKIEMLNQRIVNKVKTICEMLDEDRDVIRAEGKKYKDFFGKKKGRFSVLGLYEEFLTRLAADRGWFVEKGLELPPEPVFARLRDEFLQRQTDIYDLAALLLIKKRMKQGGDFDSVRHVVVDEAQDFGVSVFYVLHQAFPEATFTIMGDVSQNIYYDAGMNDWVELREKVFTAEKDSFYRLVKSYRNTVEISHFAGELLGKGNFETYAIEPVIRHGGKPGLLEAASLRELAAKASRCLLGMEERGLSTLAVICRDEAEAAEVVQLLRAASGAGFSGQADVGEGQADVGASQRGQFTEITVDMEDITVQKGILVLPIHMTKGLEFDGVMLWNPTEDQYPAGDANVKLLYVAVTRALHELVIASCGQGKMTPLLADIPMEHKLV